MTTAPETDENGTNHFNDDLDKIAEKETKEPEKTVTPQKLASAINENKESGDDESGLDDSSDDDAINVVTDPQQAQVNLFPKQTSSMEQVLGAQVQAQTPKVPEGGKRVMIQQGKAPPVSMQGDSSKSVYDADMVDEDKPWLRPGENISDYFNYGFDENTWKIYCERQRMIRAGLDPLSGKAVAPRKPKMQYFSTPSALKFFNNPKLNLTRKLNNFFTISLITRHNHTRRTVSSKHSRSASTRSDDERPSPTKPPIHAGNASHAFWTRHAASSRIRYVKATTYASWNEPITPDKSTTAS